MEPLGHFYPCALWDKTHLDLSGTGSRREFYLEQGTRGTVSVSCVQLSSDLASCQNQESVSVREKWISVTGTRVMCEASCVGEVTGNEPCRSAGPGLTRCVSLLKGIMLIVTGKVVISVCSFIQFMPHIIARLIDYFAALPSLLLNPMQKKLQLLLCSNFCSLALCLPPDESPGFPLHSPHQVFYLLSLILFASVYLTFPPSAHLIFWKTQLSVFGGFVAFKQLHL